MPVADRRHGLDVLGRLRALGSDDRDLLLAGLFHDAGKGRSIRLWHRVAWSLGERLGPWAHRVAAPSAGRWRRHGAAARPRRPVRGARPGGRLRARAAALIRGDVAGADAAAAALLHAADEAG